MQANLWGPVSVRGPAWENIVEGSEGTCMHTGKKESLYAHAHIYTQSQKIKLKFIFIHFLKVETKVGYGKILQVLPLRINYTIGILTYAFFPYLHLLKF